MFIILLLSSLLLSLLVSLFMTRLFRNSVTAILGRIIAEDISSAWVRYILFAMYVAGISSGVRVWDLERYVSPPPGAKDQVILVLNSDRIVLEAYRTLIGTLQGLSGVLLTFFVVGLIAYVVIRVVESRKDRTGKTPPEADRS